jgi:hypothetical protein
MFFDCPCSFRKELDYEDAIIAHLDSCKLFNEDSPLCNMYKKSGVDVAPTE